MLSFDRMPRKLKLLIVLTSVIPMPKWTSNLGFQQKALAESNISLEQWLGQLLKLTDRFEIPSKELFGELNQITGFLRQLSRLLKQEPTFQSEVRELLESRLKSEQNFSIINLINYFFSELNLESETLKNNKKLKNDLTRFQKNTMDFLKNESKLYQAFLANPELSEDEIQFVSDFIMFVLFS